MKNEALLCEIVSHSISVLGLGISNLPLIEFLLREGARDIVARDKKPFDQLDARVRALAEKGVRFVTGEGYLEGIEEATVFRSPGIRPDIPELLACRARSALVTSEMELFLALTEAKTLAVTGSDGKTTTTTLSHLMLSEAQVGGHVYCGGNIGTPLLPLVREMTERDFAVLELSSFQLMQMKEKVSSAVITNITPNHLNWHKGYAEYIEAKACVLPPIGHRIVLNAKNAETANLARRTADTHERVLFSADMPYSDMHARFGSATYYYVQDGYVVRTDREGRTEALLDTSSIRLRGRYNIENYMAASALTEPYVTAEDVRAVAERFTGVRHRLEFVSTVRGVSYYNSSIDSSPLRTCSTLSALTETPIVICGGAAKGLTFESLAEPLLTRTKALVLLGATAQEIYRCVTQSPLYDAERYRILRADSMEEAVTLAASIAEYGDTVLLSPACTSFDMYRNFEARGDHFCALALALDDDERDVRIYKNKGEIS